MDRLTFESDGYYAVSNKVCFEDQNEDYQGPAIDRLAAYEDTELMPEEIIKLKTDYVEQGELYTRLAREYEDKIALLTADLTALREANRWIPKTDRLPTREDTNEDDEVMALVKYKDGRKPFIAIIQAFDVRCDFITHWRPLPTVPEKGCEWLCRDILMLMH